MGYPGPLPVNLDQSRRPRLGAGPSKAIETRFELAHCDCGDARFGFANR